MVWIKFKNANRRNDKLSPSIYPFGQCKDSVGYIFLFAFLDLKNNVKMTVTIENFESRV